MKLRLACTKMRLNLYAAKRSALPCQALVDGQQQADDRRKEQRCKDNDSNPSVMYFYDAAERCVCP